MQPNDNMIDKVYVDHQKIQHLKLNCILILHLINKGKRFNIFLKTKHGINFTNKSISFKLQLAYHKTENNSAMIQRQSKQQLNLLRQRLLVIYIKRFTGAARFHFHKSSYQLFRCIHFTRRLYLKC